MLVIHIHQLKIESICGVYAYEQKKPRPLIVNLAITLKTDASCHSDNLADTVDYDEIAINFKKIAMEKHYNLIEHLAWVLLQSLKIFPLISHAKIELQKPNCVPDSDHTAIELEMAY